jgi:hypothetical protein
MRSRITEPGYRYAICSLRERRSALSGEINQLALTLRDRKRDLAKLDDILRILDPVSDPTSISPKRAIKHLNLFRQGELGRIIISLLRAHKQPMTNLVLARLIHDRGEYGPEFWDAIRKRTRANLAYLEKLGRIVKLGEGPEALWALVNGGPR